MDFVCVLALAVSVFGMGWEGLGSVGMVGSWRSGKSTRQPAAPVSASASCPGGFASLVLSPLFGFWEIFQPQHYVWSVCDSHGHVYTVLTLRMCFC